jgi:GNAT superfamily N-acetyltransferase
MKNYTIRKASVSDSPTLTCIAFEAKKTWNYPDHYFEIWKNELTISEEYIQSNMVYLIEFEGVTAGFYSLAVNPADQFFGEVFVEQGWWLDHMFIIPQFQKLGIGSLFMKHLTSFCSEKRITLLRIFVDPNAAGFYEKMGAKKIRSSKSSIPGREIPVYQLDFA